MNGSIYSMTEDVDPNSKMQGFDAAVRIGPNGDGFVYYGALGFFSDSWTHPLAATQKYSGTSIGGGIGYNWPSVNLNWEIISFRSSKDYLLPGMDSATVGSGQLSIGYRF